MSKYEYADTRDWIFEQTNLIRIIKHDFIITICSYHLLNEYHLNNYIQINSAYQYYFNYWTVIENDDLETRRGSIVSGSRF